MEPQKYKERKELILAPAIRPGSYMDYLDKHPEVVEASLRRMGIDPDELNRLLDEGLIAITFDGKLKNHISVVKKEIIRRIETSL